MTSDASRGDKPATAVVMAASAGIGRAIAEAFAKRGLGLAICGRNREKLDEVRQSLERLGASKVLAEVCDVSEPVDLDGFMEKALDLLGGCADVLVTNTGGPAPGATLDHDKETWDRAYQSIITSVITACRKAVPPMAEQKWGRVISIGSISAHQYLPNMALSNTFRPALAALIKTLAMEHGPSNILFYNILPGQIMTQRNIELGEVICQREGITMDELKQRWVQNNPLRRMGEPSELAEMAWFLASPACTFTTGITIPVDGGASASW